MQPHLVQSLRVRSQVILANEAKNSGNTFQAADDQVKAENSEQCEKPPGVVHVINGEHLYQVSHVFSILLDILLSGLILLDNSTDYGGGGKEN